MNLQKQEQLRSLKLLNANGYEARKNNTGKQRKTRMQERLNRATRRFGMAWFGDTTWADPAHARQHLYMHKATGTKQQAV